MGQKHSVAAIIALTIISALIVFEFASPLQISASAATPSPATPSMWSYQLVWTGGSFGTVCMALDSHNNPHIVFFGANGLMYYASWAGSYWNIQGVIQGGVPIGLVLDSKDRPHVLFMGANDLTYYASWDGSSWNYITVPKGNRYSLALDSADNPHIAYAESLLVKDYPQGVTNDISILNYASWTGANWNVQTVDKPISYSDGIYLALDRQSNPRILYGFDTYYPPNGGNIQAAKLASWSGAGWSIQTVLSNMTYFGSLVLDSNDYPHFVYATQRLTYASNNSTIGYASWNGNAWTTQTVVSNASFGWSFTANLALDSQSYPHIEFFNGSLIYASWDGANWNLQTVAPNNFAYGEGPLSIDSNGNPSVCYWVDDTQNTAAFASALLYSTPIPILTPGPTPTPTASGSPSPSASIFQLWQHTSPESETSSPTLVNGFVYVTSTNSGSGTISLSCLNQSTGKEVWSREKLFTTFTIANGYVYVSETESTLFQGVISCLNASDGTQLWNFSAGTGFTTPLVSGGIVYAGGFSYSLSSGINTGFVYAFNAITGEKLWNFAGPAGTRFDDNSLVLEGANLYAMSDAYSEQDASWHSSIFAFNANTGAMLWSYSTPSQFGSLTACNQKIYVSSNFVDTRNNLDAEKSGGYVYEGGILALNALTGNLIWNYPTQSSFETPIIMNETVYAVSDDGILYAFNADDGGMNWSYTAGTGLGSIKSVGANLYVGSSFGVFCFNAYNGKIVWNFADTGFSGSSPTLPVYADGVVYVGWSGPVTFAPSTQHNFYALDALSGEKLWSYVLGYTIESSPLVENGTVYLGASFVTTRNGDGLGSGAVLALKASNVTLPIPTPSPLPTSSSNATPSPSPSSSATPSTSPTPSPSVPEFPTWTALLGILVVSIAVAVAARRR